jgi:beta-lactamase regulating signal transducer with metallopeptidase domain/predicted  nucleic acid-binding Zn-ribbon protein
MDILALFSLGSLKAFLMLVIAGGIALTLKGRSARLRAVIWGTALVGSLLIPLAAMVVPPVPVVLPMEIPQISTGNTHLATVDEHPATHRDLAASSALNKESLQISPVPDSGWALPPLDSALMTIWAALALILFANQLSGLWRMSGIIRRARPITHGATLDLLTEVRAQVGCRPRIRLVTSSEIDIPAVFGLFRPVVILPIHSSTWLEDRLMAVLQHELIHVIRLDWPIRVAARFAATVYWFNPLVWWAKRRLDLEQEMACDEEVLSLGSRASSYACHLLGIARTAVHRPALAVAGLEMARRSDLEERIMSILNRPRHRKVGLAVILPAAILTAALVPAIAAVQPTEPGPRQASPELKAAMAEMQEAEKRLEPYIDRITDHEFELQPILEQIDDIEIDINHEVMARIETEMKPILDQIEAIHIDMEPMHAQLEAMHESFENMELHIEDGTFEQIQEQIEAQMETHHAQFESVHIDMEPFNAQMEALHAQLEPLHEQMEALHLEAIPSHEEIERIHVEMEPFQEEMERLHEEMEPLHEAMEELGERIEVAIANDVAAVLRSHLGPVTGPGAPFAEAAARIIDDANIRINDDLLELNASRRETREILTDLFSPLRIGTKDTFDDALEAAVDEVSDLEIRTD